MNGTNYKKLHYRKKAKDWLWCTACQKLVRISSGGLNSAAAHDKSVDHKSAIQEFLSESSIISAMSVSQSQHRSQPRMVSNTDIQNVREILCQYLVGRGHMSVYMLASDWMETMMSLVIRVSFQYFQVFK